MKRILLFLIHFYQKAISPYKKPCCKYYPTCSNYAVEAIERFGAFKGFFLALYRVLRCNPFSRGGYDPVPERMAFRGFTGELKEKKR
ncbi:putative membrane protein insertion efficiency factor [Caprobacter fermentans]|uniref:Putative membrane protein insertion efficiency factor n=1 Tax=Caproicibacter fermentans TaxID=2576756 RepID=A0A6N8HZH8_9FIRM|nr:membrane protein insertion efficiency factor YidD [Caproicibacter fermentans]MVB10887.1 putative membrane protein insertion efficiency factor [Caproicibacter fermentans]OCN01590.1 membrane protein insertion efficiency factor YidD [Clostridium sp. W14A]QNK39493.1 membrane protein insertion efficiency factor YidD [Caproicibacter fermentans]